MPRRPTPFPMPYLSRRHLLASGIAIAAVARMPDARAEGQVNVYNWDTYIGENTLAEFTDATGIKVRYDLYASTDEMFGKLREGNPGYDVCVPSNNFVERMLAANMLATFDKAKIPNLANIAPEFADPPYDPGLAHHAPYFWGTQGIGYRQSVTGDVDSWGVLFASDRFKGRIALLNDTDLIRNALKFLGHSLNTVDPAQVDAAAELLIKAKPNFKTFAPDTGQDLLLSGEVDLAMEWSGDIAQVRAEDEDIHYVVPKEGGLLWTDNMVIPTGGPNPDAAHVFINYILDPQVHAAIANEIRYACPNAAALEFIEPALRDDPQVYPSEETMAKCEFARYRGEEGEKLFETALTRVLAA